MKQMLTEEIKKKWAPILEADNAPTIKDRTVKNNLIRILENTEQALKEANTTASAGVTAGNTYDPILISLIRRSMPVLVANDIMGVQPMSAPTGLVFSMSAKRQNTPGAAFTDTYGSAATDTLADNGYQPNSPASDSTVTGETLGVGQQVDATSESTTEPVVQTNPWREMELVINKSSVEAKTRALKARYTQELAQDLESVHGLDAEVELASLLSGEIVSEINREMVNLVNSKARVGCNKTDHFPGLTTNGQFDVALDTDARWQVEAVKGLYFHVEREANLIGRMTGRGRGNIIICSPDIASAFEAALTLDEAPLQGDVVGGWTGVSYAGVLNNKYKVFVDPYAASDYITVGYKGASTYDSGLFYCPYRPLELMKSTGEEDFQPRLGFKTRYGMVANPFANGTNVDPLGANAGNPWYRRFSVVNVAVTQ